MDYNYSQHGYLEKLWVRLHNVTRRVTLKTGDDSGTFQIHQTEGFPEELRDNVPRVQEFSRSSMPLPGCEGVTLSNNGGYHGTQAIISTNDPRYRAKNLKGGEFEDYMVVGASSNGDGGTSRTILQGVGDWIANLFGKTINVGDTNAVTINIGTTAQSITINMGGSAATVNITGGSGDVKVNSVSLVNHTHGGIQSGPSHTLPPDKS